MRVDVALIAVLAGLWGCATSPEHREPTYRDNVERRIEAAWEETRFVVRYNPPQCACPPFEVRLGKTWQRVELVAASGEPEEDAVIADIGRRVKASEVESKPLTMTVMGRLEDEIGQCGKGALYVTLVPVGFGAEDVEP